MEEPPAKKLCSDDAYPDKVFFNRYFIIKFDY